MLVVQKVVWLADLWVVSKVALLGCVKADLTADWSVERMVVLLADLTAWKEAGSKAGLRAVRMVVLSAVRWADLKADCWVALMAAKTVCRKHC
jgi:hypothetical protein